MAFLQLIGEVTDPLAGGPLAGGAGKATVLLSSIIKLITVGAGVFAFINFIIAGIGFISAAGNPERVAQSWNKIYMSVIGLAVIIISFAFAALLGLLLFGDESAILKPTI